MASTVATICPLLGPLSTVCEEPSLFLLMHYLCVCLPNRLTMPGHASARLDVQVDPFIHGSAVPHVASLCPARHCVACASKGVRERDGVGEGERYFLGVFGLHYTELWRQFHRLLTRFKDLR